MLACSRCFKFILFLLILQCFSSQGEGFGGGRAGGKLQSGTVACRFPGWLSLLLLHEQKQTLGEKKKYNAATLTEQSSHDIRNHKAEAHAKKERGERGISWTLVLESGLEQLSPSLHARTGLERGWEKSLQNHLSAYCKSKRGRSICFGKLLLPFCKVCVAPACSREREREGREAGGPKNPHFLEDNVFQTR